jgi:hypothetical protein
VDLRFRGRELRFQGLDDPQRRKEHASVKDRARVSRVSDKAWVWMRLQDSQIHPADVSESACDLMAARLRDSLGLGFSAGGAGAATGGGAAGAAGAGGAAAAAGFGAGLAGAAAREKGLGEAGFSDALFGGMGLMPGPGGAPPGRWPSGMAASSRVLGFTEAGCLRASAGADDRIPGFLAGLDATRRTAARGCCSAAAWALGCWGWWGADDAAGLALSTDMDRWKCGPCFGSGGAEGRRTLEVLTLRLTALATGSAAGAAGWGSLGESRLCMLLEGLLPGKALRPGSGCGLAPGDATTRPNAMTGFWGRGRAREVMSGALNSTNHLPLSIPTHRVCHHFSGPRTLSHMHAPVRQLG